MLPTTLDGLPQEMPWKYKLAYLAHMFHKVEQTACPVKHMFDGDRYIREMLIPAGTTFIGRPHINGHLVQLVSGDVLAITEEGSGEVKAPFEFHSTPGYQAVFYAVTDVVGRTVHPNPDGLTDWKDLEDRDFEPAAPMLERGRMVAEKLEALCLA
jgi:hypothetical protein